MRKLEDNVAYKGGKVYWTIECQPRVSAAIQKTIKTCRQGLYDKYGYDHTLKLSTGHILSIICKEWLENKENKDRDTVEEISIEDNVNLSDVEDREDSEY